MSKQSKARDKAFQVASQHMRTRETYSNPEDYGWDLIWDAARTWTVKNWRPRLVDLETHLIAARDLAEKTRMSVGGMEASLAARDAEIERLTALLTQVTETAKLRLAKIKAVETTAEDREKKILAQAGIIERQRAGTRTLTDENNRLRDRLTAARDDARVFSAQLTDAQEELEETKAQLERTRRHTTSATWKVFEENERLVAELHRVTSLLADAEEKLAERAQVAKFLRTCGSELHATHRHLCTRPVHHQEDHLCDCGHHWTNNGIKKAVPR